MELEIELREATERGEFVLAYQPTLDLSDMRPTGVEALLRWQSPKRGLVQPDAFVPLLEETGADRRCRPLGAPRGVPTGRRVAALRASRSTSR